MTFLDIVLITLLQALADTLPLSAAGHFALLPGLVGDRRTFTAVLVAAQLGGAAGLALCLRRDLWAMARGLARLAKGKVEPGGRLLLALTAASLPALVVGWWLPHLVRLPGGPMVATGCLAGFGVLLLLADRWGVTVRRVEHVDIPTLAMIGVAQLAGMIPGVSRTGIVLTLARLLGVERPEAARLALLLSVPVLLIQAARSTWDLSHQARLVFSTDLVFASGLGLVLTWACAAALLTWLRHRSLMLFCLWRIMVAGGVLGLTFLAT